MRRWAGRFRNLSGWHRALTSLVLGLLSVGALPPLHIIPLLVVAFVGLVWLLDGVTGRKSAFAVGWWFGLGHFAGGLFWVAEAFLVYPEKHGWMIPFAIVFLAGGMALFFGLATLLTHAIGGRGMARIVALAAVWTLMEWVRGWALTGFPWNLMATVWTVAPSMLQGASLVGAYGLSLITVLLAALPATLGDVEERPWRRRLPTLAALVALVIMGSLGSWRLEAAGEPGGRVVDGIHLRLVQPNIDQSLKWLPSLRSRHVADQMALSTAEGENPGERVTPTHIIWAETAVPYDLSNNENLRQVLGRVVPPGGALITGAPRWRNPDSEDRSLWNSLHVLNGDGQFVADYDKFHLVPFGEYNPLDWVPGVTKLTKGRTDYSPGPGPRTLKVDGLPPFSPLICYEVIFPGNVADPEDRPQWLLNVTNDAWFGMSAGPYQHFAAARLRAVEEGLPLVRISNSGISGVVEPFGRVLAHLPLGSRGRLDSTLPQAIEKAPLFARVGNAIPLALSILMIGIVLANRAFDRLKVDR
ncbi:apolipoprotein N-acyltransferase [Magnetospira sp. QH-2]|uniref:apolipoprotein N-acyltransferase n=1 Tax=Magnetospira sp. (strain QH-2) TaxID=1288970 RepID=UPI0003E813BA|nr:apolipoprotein N-acyltransferase [Magnetospira sp. QH-2]CCQ75712.1 Apolipoprotein N-acyltransferase [Magnetospira sp. QH-2]